MSVRVIGTGSIEDKKKDDVKWVYFYIFIYSPSFLFLLAFSHFL